MNYFKNKTIVVPFDFSEHATRAVASAIEMADDSTGIHVIYVVDQTLSMISVDPTMPIPPSFDYDRKSRATEELQKLYGTSQYSRLTLHCVLGDPGSEITSLAKKMNADMIVMPSHGRTGLSRLLIGSVAERVLRLASCPVLILRGEI